MISIITPVLNEKECIKPFLDNIDRLEGNFELIIVDGDSTDGTLNEIEGSRNTFRHPLKVLSASRGRGSQMNKGAQAAKGEILLFLHVDSSIDLDSLEVIEKKISEDGIIGGGFTHSFSDPDAFLEVSSMIGNVRVRLTSIFFGDFGIFVRKDVFDRIGGYDEIDFLEDVEFCKRIKKEGRLEQIDRLIVTSSRRYDKIGKIKLSGFFVLALLLNVAGHRPRFLYKYITEM
jgi:rSAM/selenodomain-associated transferase 2